MRFFNFITPLLIWVQSFQFYCAIVVAYLVFGCNLIINSLNSWLVEEREESFQIFMEC